MRSDSERSEPDCRILHAHPRGHLPRPSGVPFWFGQEPSPRGSVPTGEHRQRRNESGTAGLTRGERPVGKRKRPRRRRPNTVAVQVLHPLAKDLGPALGRTARRFLALLALRGTELSILLVGDGAIRQLNRRWRDIDSATDVLSFPSGDWMRCPTFRVLPAPKCHTVRQSAPAPEEPGPVLGDVVISFDTAKRRAGKSKAVIVRELNRYLAHGLLHLLGYDHETPAEAREMAAMEEELLGDRGMI